MPITINQDIYTVSVTSADTVTLTSIAKQGPAGPVGADGVDGAGIIVSASAPAGPSEGDLWLNSGNQEFSIYTNSNWEITTYKSELADDAGDLTLNAGYF